MFSRLMPQEQKPAVRRKARVDTLFTVTPGRQYRAVQIRHTSPIFKNVAA